MVECTALEMRHTGNRIGGSNPPLSARSPDNSWNYNLILSIVISGPDLVEVFPVFERYRHARPVQCEKARAMAGMIEQIAGAVPDHASRASSAHASMMATGPERWRAVPLMPCPGDEAPDSLCKDCQIAPDRHASRCLTKGTHLMGFEHRENIGSALWHDGKADYFSDMVVFLLSWLGCWNADSKIMDLQAYSVFLSGVKFKIQSGRPRNCLDCERENE